MLCDHAARARGDQRRRRRNVEGGAAAAGAGGVEQVLAGRRDERGERAHRPCQPGELLDRLPLHAQRDQEARDLDVGGLAGHDLGQRLGGVALAEVAPVGEAIDRAGQQLTHGVRSVKLLSMSLPCSVRTDSGWN